MDLAQLHQWLGELLAANPALADCPVFTAGGDSLRKDHFIWCDYDGVSVDPVVATEVTLSSVS